MCSLFFCLSFRLKSNKELLESNFSIVGRLQLGYLHIVIADTLLLQLWSTVHKFKIELTLLHVNDLELDLETFFATDSMYVCDIFWKHTKKYIKDMHRAKCLWFFWVPIYTFNPNKLNLTCFCTWLTGDDGSSDEPQQGVLVKESESLYTLWCTGRVGCDGMLVEIKVHAVANILVLKLVSWRGGGGGQRHETLSWKC